jgi:hypothetical protein
MNDRLIKLLAEGYSPIAQLSVSNRKQSECVYIPKKLKGKQYVVHVLEKNGKYCLITEDF